MFSWRFDPKKRMALQFTASVQDPRPMAIAKLMLSVAWVDGELRGRDVMLIQQYLDSAIRMNDEDRQSFHLYQEYAIEPMERRRLARRFAQRYTRPEDRQEVIQQLESLLPVKGENLNRVIAIQEIKESLIEDQINFIKKVHYKLTRTPFPAKISDVGREAYLQEYTANPIMFRLKVRFGESFGDFGLSARRIEKLCLEMEMASLVIYADQILLPEELELCTGYLRDVWELSEKHTELLITMALCRESSEKQLPGFCRRYLELSSFDERGAFFLFLGKIAQADRHVTKGEQHMLELIAKGLEIPAGVRRSVLEHVESETAVIE